MLSKALVSAEHLGLPAQAAGGLDPPGIIVPEKQLFAAQPQLRLDAREILRLGFLAAHLAGDEQPVEERLEAHCAAHVCGAVGLLRGCQADEVARPAQRVHRRDHALVRRVFRLQPGRDERLGGAAPTPPRQVGPQRVCQRFSPHQALVGKVVVEERSGHRGSDAVLAFQVGAETIGKDDDAVGVEEDGANGLNHANIMT